MAPGKPRTLDCGNRTEYHKIFSGEIDRMMDAGHDSCVLREKEFRKSPASTSGQPDPIHFRVVMPNHVHLLFTLSAEIKLEAVISTWKRHTARRINTALGSQGALWQKDYFDRIVRDWKHFANVARYIRRNPAKARLCQGEFTSTGGRNRKARPQVTRRGGWHPPFFAPNSHVASATLLKCTRGYHPRLGSLWKSSSYLQRLEIPA